jgi:hypothetical protein
VKFKAHFSNGEFELYDKPFPPKADEHFAHSGEMHTMVNLEVDKGKG